MTTSAAPAAAAGDRTWLDRAYAALPLATIFIWLAALYAYQSWRHTSPWLFTDELELTQLSRSIAETGEAARRGEPHFFETLYTYLTAPAWWLDSTTPGVRPRPLHRRVHDDRGRLPDVLPRADDRRQAGRRCSPRRPPPPCPRSPTPRSSRRRRSRTRTRRSASSSSRRRSSRARRWWIAGAVAALPRRPARPRRARRDRRRVRARGVLLLPDERCRAALARCVDGLGLGRRGGADDGRDRLLLGRRGQLLAELADRNRPLPRADDRVRRLGRRRLRHRPRRAARRRRARGARPPQGRGADAGAARVHGAPAPPRSCASASTPPSRPRISRRPSARSSSSGTSSISSRSSSSAPPSGSSGRGCAGSRSRPRPPSSPTCSSRPTTPSRTSRTRTRSVSPSRRCRTATSRSRTTPCSGR